MSRPRHRLIGGPTVRIGDTVYSQALAKILFRCGVCLAELKEHNAGLICSKDKTHRGYIKLATAAERQAAEQIKTNLAKIEDEIWTQH